MGAVTHMQGGGSQSWEMLTHGGAGEKGVLNPDQRNQTVGEGIGREVSKIRMGYD